jgi:ribosomal-protein-alanine N-acetyltransferase
MNSANLHPLSTPRLVLRPLCIRDAEALHRIHHEAGVWKHFKGSPPATVEEERRKIERHLDHYERHGFGPWAAVLRETSELIGLCGLLRRELDGAVEIELMYVLSPRFWGQRLASESARRIRDYALKSLGLTRLISLIAAENISSKRVALAAGMRFLRQTQFDGQLVEIYCTEQLQADRALARATDIIDQG